MVQYNLSNTWKIIKYVYSNISGSWKTIGQIYINMNGIWKPIWSYQWKTGNWSNCSVSCGGGTQSRSVTCYRNDGQTVLDSLCIKYVGSKPITSQVCNTQACEECKYSRYSNPKSYWVLYTRTNKVGEVYFNGTLIHEQYGSNVSGGGTITKNGYIYYAGSRQTSDNISITYSTCRKPV